MDVPRTSPGRRRVASRWALAALVALVAVVGAGCTVRGIRGASTSAPPPTQAPSTTTVAASTTVPPATTTTVPPPYPVSAIGSCRGPVGDGTLAATSDDRPDVPCGQPHGSETALVLDAALAGVGERPDDRSDLPAGAFARVVAGCQQGFDAYLGLPPLATPGRAVSRLVLAWFLPTPEEWDLGARWARCDAVVVPVGGQGGTYAGPFRGVLADGQVPEALAACFDRALARVRCDAAHVFEAIGDAAFPPGEGPPEADAVAAARVAQCDPAGALAIGVGTMAEQPLLAMTLVPPTPARWEHGDHIGLCLVGSAGGRDLDDSVRGIGSTPPPFPGGPAPEPTTAG